MDSDFHVSPAGMEQGRDQKIKQCPVCRLQVNTAVYDDAFGHSGRLFMADGACPGSFRAVGEAGSRGR